MNYTNIITDKKSNAVQYVVLIFSFVSLVFSTALIYVYRNTKSKLGLSIALCMLSAIFTFSLLPF